MNARARVCAFYFVFTPSIFFIVLVGIVFLFLRFVPFCFHLFFIYFIFFCVFSVSVCLSHCECFVVCYQFNLQDCIPCTRTGGISKSCFMFQHYCRMRSMIRKSCRGNVTLATTSCALYFWKPITHRLARLVLKAIFCTHLFW